MPTVTREELYEMVWSMPALRIAKSFGISDVALGKICRRHSIPKPTHGYWAKVSNGQVLQKLSLPPAVQGAPTQIEIEATPKRRAYKADAEKSPRPLTIVYPDRPLTHPYVLRTKGVLDEYLSIDRFGRVNPAGKDVLDLSVCLGSVERALRIWDALLFALEARGYPARVVPDIPPRGWRHITSVIINGSRVNFKMDEPTKRGGMNGTGIFATRIYVPVVGLRFVITSLLPEGKGTRVSWTDGSKNPLELKIDDFIDGLILAAEQVRLQDIEHAKRAEEWRKEREAEEEEERLVKEEERRREFLHERLERWRKTRELHALIGAVERRVASEVFDPADDLSQWLTWAGKYAASLDPVPEIIRRPFPPTDE